MACVVLVCWSVGVCGLLVCWRVAESAGMPGSGPGGRQGSGGKRERLSRGRHDGSRHARSTRMRPRHAPAALSSRTRKPALYPPARPTCLSTSHSAKPEEYSALIRAGDADGIMALLTDK